MSRDVKIGVGLGMLAVVGGSAGDPRVDPAAAVPVVESFGRFVPPAGQAHYLACPQNYCLGPVDELTGILPVNADKLRAVVRRAIDGQPGTVLLVEQNEGLKLVYHQTGAGFGAAGTVTIDIVDVSETEGAIAMYSQSDRVGNRFVGDRLRVERWLAEIESTARR